VSVRQDIESIESVAVQEWRPDSGGYDVAAPQNAMTAANCAIEMTADESALMLRYPAGEAGG
jgi:hypothetical protein